MYQDRDEALMVQNRFFQALMHEQHQKELQKHLQQHRRMQDESLEQMLSWKSKQQHQNLPTFNTHLSIPPSAALPPTSRQIIQQDPIRFSQHDPNHQVQLSLLELENQVRAEEHALIIQSNQRRVAELHHQAIQLEEQIKLREREFMRERSRLVDMQTVNRLRIQADELEKRLMMYGDVQGFCRK